MHHHLPLSSVAPLYPTRTILFAVNERFIASLCNRAQRGGIESKLNARRPDARLFRQLSARK